MVKKEAVKKATAKAETPAPKAAEKSAAAPLGHGVGRRKSSVARVWLRRGKGAFMVNDRDYLTYFDTEITRKIAAVPFQAYPQASKYDVEVNVSGGGLTSQAGAIKLGIARALLEVNPDIRPLLRDYGLLTVDSRVKERKKYGQKAARRKFQFVKR
jgi:small subunit ribosomal protein S9